MDLSIGLVIAALLAAAVGPGSARQKAPGPAQTTAKPPIACPTTFRPVCGLGKDGRQLNYDNECLAKAAGVKRIEHGPCIADITIDESGR